jgi:hypothetical protein
VIPFDVLRAVGAAQPATWTWELAHVGADWHTGLDCDCVNAVTLNQPGYSEIPDYTGDGLADLGSHHRSTGNFNVRANLGSSFSGTNFSTGATPAASTIWETLTGDFNGDGRGDYADRHIPTGQVWVHLNMGTYFDSGTWAFGYTASGPNLEVLTGDFNGDGRADILEHNRKTGQLWIRENLGAGGNQFEALINVAISFRSQAGTTGQDWRIVVADFDGDNRADIADVHVPSFTFYVHPNVGGSQFNLTSWSGVTPFAWPNFTTVFGDFDADGLADYADVNRGTGEIWTHKNMNGSGWFNTGTHFAYGTYTVSGGGYWILGLPVSLP